MSKATLITLLCLTLLGITTCQTIVGKYFIYNCLTETGFYYQDSSCVQFGLGTYMKVSMNSISATLTISTGCSLGCGSCLNAINTTSFDTCTTLGLNTFAVYQANGGKVSFNIYFNTTDCQNNRNSLDTLSANGCAKATQDGGTLYYYGQGLSGNYFAYSICNSSTCYDCINNLQLAQYGTCDPINDGFVYFKFKSNNGLTLVTPISALLLILLCFLLF